MKKILSKVMYGIMIMSILASLLVVPVMAEGNIKVVLNGTELTFDIQPQLINDRTMVPMRKIYEALGAEVEWEEDTQTITATKEDIVIIMQIDNYVISVSGQDITLDVPPQLVGERTLVPVRAVAEGLNADVEWVDETQTVIINDKVADVTIPARNPNRGQIYGYGNDGISELQYNARYLLEQRVMPQFVSDYSKETINFITSSNTAKMKEIVLAMWETAAASAIYNDAELSGEKPEEYTDEEFWKIIDERRPIYGLDDNHIEDVTIEKINSDTRAVIVKLRDTGWNMLSTYVGIAYNKATGLKCFTLEKSLDISGTGIDTYMFCFVEVDSRGSYNIMKNDKQSFINGIKGVMSPEESNTTDTSVLIDGVKCTLKATMYALDTDDTKMISTGLSVYNEDGENVTSGLYFGEGTITKGLETVKFSINKTIKGVDTTSKFESKWEAGEYADITLEVKGNDGKTVEMSAKNVKIMTMVEALQNMLGDGYIVTVE